MGTLDSAYVIETRTKDQFLNKAHEARQARELARRRDDAATTIQSYVRKFIVQNRLKREITKDLTRLEEGTDVVDVLNIVGRALFFCSPYKDRDVITSTLSFIHNNSSKSSKDDESRSENVIETHNSIGILRKLDPSKGEGSIELSNENVPKEQANNPKGQKTSETYDGSFLVALIEKASKDEKSYTYSISLAYKIVQTCLLILDEINDNKTDLQQIVMMLKLVNLFSLEKELLYSLKTVRFAHEMQVDVCTRLSIQLSSKTITWRTKLLSNLYPLMPKLVKGPKNEAKSRLLDNYTKLALGLLNLNQPVDCSHNIALLNQKTRLLIKLLSVPGLIHNLEHYSLSIIDQFKQRTTFQICLKFLSLCDQELQSLTSTPALCLVANLIHLAALDEALLSSELITFSICMTKLFESCQRNMKLNSTNCNRIKENKRSNEPTDESYNHILGWLIREQTYTIDQDTSKLIKRQLDHLWSTRFLKILFADLVELNEEKHKQSVEQKKTNNVIKPDINLLGHKTSSNVKQTRSSDHNCQIPSDIPMNSTVLSFKKVVERAANNMTRSLGYSYAKTTGTSSLNQSSSKLMTEEARRVALVCFMLHTALKTLRIVKQDILTGLCIHDYILNNLWTFISSLSSQNGLKAFLEYLTYHTKTNMPEFHILMLFCECSSHIISILDDSELYEQQKPFSIEDLINISAFLNMFVYRIISNQLVDSNIHDMDPILQTTHKLLTDLYKRDCRRKFAPQDHWLIKDLKMSIFIKDLEARRPFAQAILTLLPHIIPHKERVLIFRKLVAKDRALYFTNYSTFITIHRSRIVEDGYQQLARLPPNALKGLIRVKFINDHGLDEAGIDQDGVFKEFLEDTIKRVFDPALNLFCTTSENRLYPSPTSRLHEDHLSLFNFVGKMLGKAVYEGIVVDVPFASFFLSRVLGQHQSALYSPIDELPSLDPELYKSLTYIKHYEGDVSELELTFSIDQDMMGKIETYELESGGKFIPVTKESRVRYIHSVANFRMKTQIEEQTDAFVRGFKSIINLEWLHMFSASEFQRLISGDTAPIDLQDLRKHTKYFGGFHNNHRVVCWLWDILEKDFTPEEHRLFLKFVTSCSKPPLLGFANLGPPFSIRCVEVSDDQDLGDTVGSVLRGFFAIRRSDPVDRLPTSSTCFNLLKLPNYQRRSTLREKLRYAIRSSTGFELS